MQLIGLPTKKRHHLNKATKALLITNGLILISAAMLGPIYALFIGKIGGDLLDASYAFGIFAFVAGATTLISGKYADNLKESELIVALGYVLIGIGFLGYIFVDSIGLLLLVQVIIGLGEAIYSPAFDALYSKHLEEGRSGSIWGTWEAINYFTIAIGAVSGGILVTLFGFNAMFIIMALLSFGSALYILWLPRDLL